MSSRFDANSLKTPEKASLVFMGCKEKGSDTFNLGVIGTPEEILTPGSYSSSAKKVKNFYVYYDLSKSIGISGSRGVKLNSCDISDTSDD